MSEQPTQPTQPSRPEDQASQPDPDPGVERPGGGRTAGETSVDEAMGAEDEPPP
jgi:hypothetical protein